MWMTTVRTLAAGLYMGTVLTTTTVLQLYIKLQKCLDVQISDKTTNKRPQIYTCSTGKHPNIKNVQTFTGIQ